MAAADGGAGAGRFVPLRWAMLGLLALLCVIFYEDVMEMRIAARHMVLGKETSKNKFATVEEHDRVVAAERSKQKHMEDAAKASAELGRKGGRAPVTEAPPAPTWVPADGEETATKAAEDGDKVEGDGDAGDGDTLIELPPEEEEGDDSGDEDAGKKASDEAAPSSEMTREAEAEKAAAAAEAGPESTREPEPDADVEKQAAAAAAAVAVAEATLTPTPDPEPEPGSESPDGAMSYKDLEPGGAVPLPDVSPDVGGEWRSIGKVQPLNGEDLSQPGALEAAAKKRSFRKEIIIFVNNKGGNHLAANMVANLRSVGIEHYLIVTNTPECCKTLMDGPWGITCGWTSYLLNHPRLVPYGVQAEEVATPFRLWWVRFHFLERLVALGYNPMYIDTDVSFRVNPYPLLKGPLGKYSLFGQDETGQINGINIGVVYAQNARVGGGAHWVLNETVSRMWRILEAEPIVTKWDGTVAGGAKEMLWDQHIYNDVVESAIFGKEMYRRSYQRMIDPANGQRDKWEVEWGYPQGGESMQWRYEDIVIKESELPLTPTGARLALTPGTHSIKARPLKCYGLDPEEATREPEKMVAAPPWLIAGWSGVAGEDAMQGVSGNWNIDPPKFAIAHMVGALAKQTTFKSLGWWHFGSEIYRTWGLTSLERELNAGGALAVSGLRVDAMHDDPEKGAEAYALALARIVELAVAAGRRPVIPALNCHAPWIQKDQGSFLGVRDRQIAIVSARCDADSAGGGGGPPLPVNMAGAEKASGLGACCASVNFDCNEGVILQVDLDRDPRYSSLHDDVAYVKVEKLLSEPGASGTVDGATLEERLKGPRLMVVELGKDGGWGGEWGVPLVTKLTSHQRERIDRMFRGCENLNCIPPRKPWPHHNEPCRMPHQ